MSQERLFQCFRCKHCSFLTRNDLAKSCFLLFPKSKAKAVLVSVRIIIFWATLPITRKQPELFSHKLTRPLPLPPWVSSLNTLYDSGSRHQSNTYVSYLYFCAVRYLAALTAFIEVLTFFFSP